jgi:hypothetical protein
MIRKLRFVLLLLCTTLTLSATNFASADTTQIQASITPLNYSPVRPQSDGTFHDGLLFAEQSNGALVYYNTKGKLAFTLPANVKPLGDFLGQRALVRNIDTNRYGYINTTGKLVIPCTYLEAGYFSEGVAHVTMANSNEAFIDRSGKVVTTLQQKYSSEYIFSEGLALAYAPRGNKIGFINTSGELAISYKYTYARGFSEGLAVVQNSEGLYGYIDTSGKQVIPFQYKSAGDYSERWAPVQNTKGKWGFIDKQGKIVIPYKYNNAHGFSEGLATVYNASGHVGFINTKGTLVIGYQKYNRAFPFKEGFALVGVVTKSDPSGKFGYIDRQGKLLTKLAYQSASSSFNNGHAVALKDLGTGYILTKRP